METTSQKWKIIAYLQKHPKEVVEAKNFQWIFNLRPFIGYSCSARLSELKTAWYIKVVGMRNWLFNKVIRRNKQIYQYQITTLGINLKLK
jgi:hypothetical protein